MLVERCEAVWAPGKVIAACLAVGLVWYGAAGAAAAEDKPAEDGATGAAKKRAPLRVMTYNIHAFDPVAAAEQGRMRIGEIRKATCGINGATGSPVIPAIDPPEGLDWDMWLGPAPKGP